MRFSIAAAAAFVAGASASYGYGVNTTVPEPVYTTEIVTELTTVCPEPTKITQGGKTYTVTTSTTLTITDCPCTVTKIIDNPAHTPAPPAKETTIYTPPVVLVPSPVPYPSQNATSLAVPAPVAPTGTAPGAPGVTHATVPGTPEFTGAAAKMGAGAMAVVAAAAAFL